MKLTQKIRRGERIRIVHPETGTVLAEFDCVHGRADLTFEGYLVEVQQVCECEPAKTSGCKEKIA